MTLDRRLFDIKVGGKATLLIHPVFPGKIYRKVTSPRAMKRFLLLCTILPLSLFLCGFFGGAPTWKDINARLDRQYPTVKDIDIDTLKASLDQKNPLLLIDVRDKEEFAVSHLPGAVNLTETGEVTVAKDTAIIVYCSVGVRSAAFAKELSELGFTDVRNLRGSIFAWANKGYPLRRGDKPVEVVHPYDKKWGVLLNRELHLYHLTQSAGESQ